MAIDEKTLKKIEAELEWPYFCSLVFKIDNYAGFKENVSPKHQLLTKFAICNISKEIIERHLHCQTIDMGKDQASALLCLQKHAFPVAFMDSLRQIQSTVESLYNISISIAIGDIVTGKDQISLSYQSALEYASYRLFLGRRSIIDYDKVKHQLDVRYEYPYSVEKKLLQAIESQKPASLNETLDLFMTSLADSSMQHTFFYCHQLVSSVYRYFSHVLEVNARGTQSYLDLIKNLETLESLEEIRNFIHAFCKEICGTLLESKNKPYNQNIEQVEDYLKEHYANPNLSLESMADFAGVSPGYFGKIFRSAKNCSFNDYLNQLRLEQAKQYLTQTDEPVSSISEKVGIANSNYFYTLFKKTYGMTPAQYRKHPEKLSAPGRH